MGRIKVSYSTIMEECPASATEALKSFRKGRSKHKGAPLKDLEWAYFWITRYDGGEVALLQTMTACMAAADEAKRSYAWVMVGAKSAGNKPRVKLENIPKTLLGLMIEKHERWRNETRAFQSLPREQQEREIKALLGKLSKTPGFVIIPGEGL